jgi:hypothetical protein
MCLAEIGLPELVFPSPVDGRPSWFDSASDSEDALIYKGVVLASASVQGNDARVRCRFCAKGWGRYPECITLADAARGMVCDRWT